ncbi:unnamed protein product, partial [Meganyctiphanes norvegica]
NSTTALTKGGTAGSQSPAGRGAGGATTAGTRTSPRPGDPEQGDDDNTGASRPLVPLNKNLGNVKAQDGAHPSMAFFQNRSLSLVDMYIDTSEPTENVGQIQFSMEYNFNEMTLILRIMQ